MKIARLNDDVVKCALKKVNYRLVSFLVRLIFVFLLKVVENLLPEHHSEIFIELVQDIVHQLKEHPDRLPVVHCQMDVTMSPGTSRKPREREREHSAEPVRVSSSFCSLFIAEWIY